MNKKHEDFLTAMYQKYFPNVYNYIYYQVNNYAVSDDITSSVFMKVVENIDKFDSDKAKFSTWVFTITRHTLIDYYRKQKKDSDITDYEESLQCSLSFEDAYRAYTQEISGDVGELMEILNEKEKTIVYLRYFEGLPFKEIGLQLNKNSSSVRTLHERALKKLLQYMQKQGIRYEDMM